MKELMILGSSILYFTRLPLPFKVPYSKDAMARILTWFPMVGLLVGGIGATTWWCCYQFFPNTIALVLSMVTTILVTGAFHEDGLGDICDGFGGGYTVEKKLSIMKDSCIGAYGAIGIVMMLLTKFLVLSQIPVEYLFIAIILGHSLSRGVVLIITHIWKYVRLDDSAKARQTTQKLHPLRLLIALLLGAVPLIWVDLSTWYVLPIVASLIALAMGKYCHKHIGGFTGDCLGAAQQVIEVSLYLSFIVLV